MCILFISPLYKQKKLCYNERVVLFSRATLFSFPCQKYKLVFIGELRRGINERIHLNHCRDRRSTAVRSRSGSDNRTGLSFITLTPLRYLDGPKTAGYDFFTDTCNQMVFAHFANKNRLFHGPSRTPVPTMLWVSFLWFVSMKKHIDKS